MVTDSDSVVADVTVYGEIRDALSAANQRRPVDFVVTSVGVSYFSPIGRDYGTEWTEIVRTNIVGLLVVMSVIEELRLPLRDFIHIGSVASRTMSTVKGNECYSVTKGAQQRLVDHFRERHRSQMRVSSISPGFTRDTAFLDRFTSRERVHNLVMLDEDNSLTAADVADCVATVLGSPGHVEWSDVVLAPAASSASRPTAL